MGGLECLGCPAEGYAFAKINTGPVVSQGGDSTAAAMANLDGDPANGLEVLVTNFDGRDNFYYRNLGPVWTKVGGALPGAFTPGMDGFGPLVPGTPATLEIVAAPPDELGILYIGLDRIDLPFQGGTLVPAPDFVIPVPTNALGGFQATKTWPPTAPAQAELFFQFWVPDLGGPAGLSATDTLRAFSQ